MQARQAHSWQLSRIADIATRGAQGWDREIGDVRLRIANGHSLALVVRLAPARDLARRTRLTLFSFHASPL